MFSFFDFVAQNFWKKLETSNSYKPPHVRAAHASATVRENQVLYYGGSIGNGQYATDDLWFLDIKIKRKQIGCKFL
jgi:hypothetical protein